MKILVVVALCFVTSASVFAQQSFPDSLRSEVMRTGIDTNKVRALYFLGRYYFFVRQDSSIYYTAQSIEVAERINDSYGAALGYAWLGFLLNTSSNYTKALELAQKGLKIAEQMKENRAFCMAECFHVMGIVNRRMGYDTLCVYYSQKAIDLYKESGAPKSQINFGPPLNIALVLLKWHKPDSALYFAQMGYEITKQQPKRLQGGLSALTSLLGMVYEAMGNRKMALSYYLEGLNVCKMYPATLLTVRFYNEYARFFRKIGNEDSCIYYASLALRLSQHNTFGEHASDAATILTETYEAQHKPDSALKYMKAMLAIKDTIFSQSKSQQFMLLNFDEGQRQKDIEAARERYRTQVRLYSLISAAGIFLLLTIILYRNNRSKNRANHILASQKREIEIQRTKAENALDELKATQAQLIQSEKMSSLGELTAGIAHEIQNPLNFVNNFSEVNRELINEMKSDIETGNLAGIKTISTTLEQNLEKILHHGQRADSIVRSMLQHSRKTTGEKEPADINALCDEYLRLAYHGFRAKDKLFNATLLTDFDNSIGKIKIIPQDIGRVLLNLYNNAFYAVREKAKLAGSTSYEPAISISTKNRGSRVEIVVKDNGTGIAESKKDKIFQPFFTTKPSGDGTGLGLSLAYDIVTKLHGGEFKLKSVEGEGSEFLILLPASE